MEYAVEVRDLRKAYGPRPAVDGVDFTVANAETAEREAFAANGASGERELASVKAWIASGCEGPKPQPDPHERRALTESLMAAMGGREAAHRAK